MPLATINIMTNKKTQKRLLKDKGFNKGGEKNKLQNEATNFLVC